MPPDPPTDPSTDPPTDAGADTGRAGPARLRLASKNSPRREWPKPLGVSRRGELIGLTVEDARHHVHVQGVTGTGKSTWLARHVLAEADAGRGVALLDCQGDLVRHVLDRLPAHAGRRLVLLDPAETQAPPAWNVLTPTRADGGLEGRERAAENVIGTIRRLYAAWWGPRMDEVFRAACLTAARRPAATLPDIVAVLTHPGHRRRLLAEHGEPDGLDGFWHSFEQLTDTQRHQLCGPVLSRLRSVLSRRFARDLLGTPASTIDLTQVLDGGILLARLPKGELGENTAQLLGSLLLSGLWWTTTARSAVPAEHRLDATVVVDECHNFLHLPIGMDDALAEARGYRLSLVLAHQHSTQLSPEVRDAIDGNARTKILFTISPTDAPRLEHHVTPYYDAADLTRQPGFTITARLTHHGHHAPPCTLATEPLPDPIPGRGDQLRDTARQHTGLSGDDRAANRRRQQLVTAPGTGSIRPHHHPDQTSPDHQRLGNQDLADPDGGEVIGLGTLAQCSASHSSAPSSLSTRRGNPLRYRRSGMRSTPPLTFARGPRKTAMTSPITAVSRRASSTPTELPDGERRIVVHAFPIMRAAGSRCRSAPDAAAPHSTSTLARV